MFRAIWAWVFLLPVAVTAHAGTVAGKVELPSPPRPPVKMKGFLDRIENPLAPVKPLSLARDVVIVLEGDEKPVSPPQLVIELLGETFARNVVAAPAGAEVVIKNLSKHSRALVAAEDPKLLPQGPLNPSGTKPFRATEVGKVYTIGDKDAPHLELKIVVVNTQYVGYPDDSGRFEIDGVPPGMYKAKIWYRDRWLERPDDAVNVPAKGKADYNPKVAADALAPAAQK